MYKKLPKEKYYQKEHLHFISSGKSEVTVQLTQLIESLFQNTHFTFEHFHLPAHHSNKMWWQRLKFLWEGLSVKRPTLEFGSGHESHSSWVLEPCVGLHPGSAEPAWHFLSLCPSPTHVLSLSLKLNLKKLLSYGAPEWLSQLSIRLRLRSWSHGSWVQAPSGVLSWQCRACLGFSLSLPFPLMLALSLSL